MELNNLFVQLMSLQKTTDIGLENALVFRPDDYNELLEKRESGQLTFAQWGRLPSGDSAPSEEWVGLERILYLSCRQPIDGGFNWFLTPHLLLIFVEAGSISLSLYDGKQILVSQNQLAVVRPWSVNMIENVKLAESRVYGIAIDVGAKWPNQNWTWPNWVIIERLAKDRLSYSFRNNDDLIFDFDKNLCRKFQLFGKYLTEPRESFYLSRIITLTNDILIDLSALFDQTKIRMDSTLSNTEHTVKIFLNSLENRLLQRQVDWTVEKMAAECGICPTLFANYCRRLTNKPPADFLRTLRIKEACSLLEKHVNLSVKEIAFICGFKTKAYFSTAFKRETGMSPREYRLHKQGEHNGTA